MSSTPKICATNVFLALIDLDKPSRAADVTDYLAGETGADSRRLALPVRRQLDYLVRKGCIEKRPSGTYCVVRDECMIRERLKILEAQDTEYLNRPCLEKKAKKTQKISCYKAINAYLSFPKSPQGDTTSDCRLSLTGCVSIAAIPRQIRRENPVLRSTMSQAEFEYTQRFWREPLAFRYVSVNYDEPADLEDDMDGEEELDEADDYKPDGSDLLSSESNE